MNICCLDFDDCIFPSSSNYFGKTSDSLEILELNLKRLTMILNNFAKYLRYNKNNNK